MNITRAVIGGSGLYDIEGATVIEEKVIETPWGAPSDRITIAEINGHETAFLPRHGKGHRHLPSQVNNRANIAALKMLGVREIFAFSAVGSLKEEIAPGDFVIPDQVIDRTRQRASTFFGDGIVGHIAFADPFCSRLHDTVRPHAEKQGIKLHENETLICMEGPAFSTRAESHLYRSWGAGVINMSTLPEAKLAREAEICYSVICMSTDYDCWKEDEAHVTVDMVVQTMKANTINARSLIEAILTESAGERSCSCGDSTRHAVMTAPDAMDPETRKSLKAILPDYF